VTKSAWPITAHRALRRLPLGPFVPFAPFVLSSGLAVTRD
jgi:hypothetical protein